MPGQRRDFECLCRDPLPLPEGGQEVRRARIVEGRLPTARQFADPLESAIAEILPSSRVMRHRDAVPGA